MKKGIAAILLVIYVAFSSGIVISYHYCMDTLSSFQLGTTDDHICAKCGMEIEGPGGCCSDEVKIYKVDDDQQVSAISFKFNSSEPVVLTPVIHGTAAISKTSKGFLFNNHSPPLSKQDTYLQNCVFRI
jgi:hypothetical protein